VDGLLDEQERGLEREVKAVAALEKNTSGTYTESKRASNVSSETSLRDSGRQNVTYDPERAASRTDEDAEKLPEQEVNHASADTEIESLAFEAKPISSRELGVPGGTDRQNIRLVEWGETEATWMARQMAEHQGLKLVLFVGDDLEIDHNGKTVRTQSYMDGDNVYIRADHPVYTAEELMHRENGNRGLIINRRDSSRGKPQAILMFDISLNYRQNELLKMLPSYDNAVVVPKNTVSMFDLAALTAKTGVEFSMFTKGSERLIIRGDSRSVNVDVAMARQLAEKGYRWSGHTHPGVDDLVKIPSSGDIAVLRAFNQKESVIFDSMGRYAIFEG